MSRKKLFHLKQQTQIEENIVAQFYSVMDKVNYNILLCWLIRIPERVGGGPREVVSTAAFHARVRGSVPGLGGLKETKFVSSPSTCES